MIVFIVITIFGYLAIKSEVTAKPMRVTIDCGSEDRSSSDTIKLGTIFKTSDELDVDTFCDLIQKVVPKAVKNGQFIPSQHNQDMASEGDTFNPIFEAAPRRFLGSPFKNTDLGFPRIKVPPLKIPTFKVPTLKATNIQSIKPPKIGNSMIFPKLKNAMEQDSSAEKMEKFKKGIQKMLDIVKVLGQVDQYVSKRTRIVIDKLYKTFSD